MTGRQAIEQWQQKHMDGNSLKRALVTWTEWQLQVSEQAVADMLAANALGSLSYVQESDGTRRLFVYTDAEAYRTWQSQDSLPGGHFLQVTGRWLFSLPLDDIDWLTIDPGTPHTISYNKQQLPSLKALAAAIEVEDALHQLRAGQGDTSRLLKQVLSYDGYQLVLVKSGDDRQVIGLAPDTKGRSLAAVFTAEDAMLAYEDDALQQVKAGVSVQAGRQLFERLAGLDVDGVVFNCCGPDRPVAFAREFAQVVLEA